MAPSRIGLFIVGANRQIPSIGGNLGLAHLQILHLTTTCFCCFQMPLCYSPSIEYNLQHLKASPAIRNSHSNETVLFPGWLIGRRVNVVAALRAAGVTVLVRARAGCTEPHVVLAPVCSKNPCSGSVLLIGPHSDLSDVPCPSPGEAFKSTPRATRGGGHRARSQRCSRDQHSRVRHQVASWHLLGLPPPGCAWIESPLPPCYPSAAATQTAAKPCWRLQGSHPICPMGYLWYQSLAWTLS